MSPGALRLRALLGGGVADGGNADGLNAALCEGIANGAIALADPALLDHLRARSLARLAIAQPACSAGSNHRGMPTEQ